MSFATDDLREDILELFVSEHDKINQFDFVYADLTVFDLEQKKETERKSRLLDLHWIRRHDRERKNLQRFSTPETIVCPVCKKNMLSFITPGHARVYCSEKCKQKSKRYKRNKLKCVNLKQAQ